MIGAPALLLGLLRALNEWFRQGTRWTAQLTRTSATLLSHLGLKKGPTIQRAFPRIL